MRNNPSIMSDIIPIDSEITTFSDYLNNNCRGFFYLPDLEMERVSF